MAFGEDKPVPIRILRVFHIILHLPAVKIGNHICGRKASARMAGLCIIRTFDNAEPDLRGIDLQFSFLLTVHGLLL